MAQTHESELHKDIYRLDGFEKCLNDGCYPDKMCERCAPSVEQFVHLTESYARNQQLELLERLEAQKETYAETGTVIATGDFSVKAERHVEAIPLSAIQSERNQLNEEDK